MAGELLTDEEVFGGAGQDQLLSDDDVFGPGTTPQPEQLKVGRRGTMRGGASPYVAGDPRGKEQVQRAAFAAIDPRRADRPVQSVLDRPSDPATLRQAQENVWQQENQDGLAPWARKRQQDEAAAEQASRNAGTIKGFNAPSTVDRFIDSTRAKSESPSVINSLTEGVGDSVRIARDLGIKLDAGTFQAIKMAADVVRMLPGAANADPLVNVSRWAEASQQVADQATSPELQQAAAGLNKLTQDPNADVGSVLGYLLTHPALLSAEATQSLPNMVGSVGLGKMASALMGRVSGAVLNGATARGAAAEYINALSTKAAEIGAVTGETLMGAGGVFDDVLKQGGSIADAYRAAGVTAIGYGLVGVATGGGAEGALASGRRGGVFKGMGKEGLEEGAQNYAEAAGKAVGTGVPFDPNQQAKEAAIDATVGAAIGGMAEHKGGAAPVGPVYDEAYARQLAQSKGFLNNLPPPIRVEDQQTTPLTPEQVQQMAAEKARTNVPPPASDLAAKEPAGDAAVGVSQVPQGSLAAQSEALLRQRAQEGSDVSPGTAPADVAAGGSEQRGADAAGSLENPGLGAGVGPAVGGAPQGAGAPRAPNDAVQRASQPSETLNATPLPERQDGSNRGAAGDARSDDDLRSVFSTSYTARAAQLTREADAHRQQAQQLAAEAAAYRRTGTAELTQRATKLEAKAALLQSLAEQKTAVAADMPANLQAPKPELQRSFQPLQDAAHQAFGRRLVAYYDERDGASDGFTEKGVSFINLARPERSVAFTVFHELQHVVRQEAQAGNRQSKLATQMLDQVWGMIPESAKVQYAQNYLFKQGIQDGQVTVEQALKHPKLRDEMLSDFMGKRATDAGFMQSLADKHPRQFGGFARRWIDTIAKLLDSLKGTRRNPATGELDRGGLKDIDRAIKNLDRAKVVAEKVLRAWADSNPQLAKQQGIGPSDGQQPARSAREESVSSVSSVSPGQTQKSVSGTVVEVAPHPDKPAAKDWKQLDQQQRQAVTKDVMDRVFPQVLRELGWPKATYTFGSGTFEGEVNPNATIEMPGASFEQVAEMARVMGYVLDQKAMVAFDENDRTGGSQAGFVKVIPPATMSTEQVNSLRRSIAQAVPQANGDTVRDGAIIYGNFSDLSDQDFHDAIVAAVDALPDRIEVLPVRTSRSEYIQPDTREGFLEGTRYGGSEAGLEAGRDALRGQARGDLRRLQQIAAGALQRRADGVAGAVARGRASPAEPGAADGGGGGPQRSDAPGSSAAGARDAGSLQGPQGRLSYGTPKPGAISAEAYHYSQEDRAVLTSVMFGRGLKGAERQRLESADPLLSQRINFYVDRGTGINPEAGVGGRAHRVELRNLYDVDADPQRLLRDAQGFNDFERAVIKAGFDGYVMRDAGPSGNAVLLGRHTVPVENLGPAAKITGARVLPKAAPMELTAAERIAANKSLPAGNLTGKRWGELVRATMPKEFAEYADAPVWGSDERYYRDELARELQRGDGPSRSMREDELGNFNLDNSDDYDYQTVVADDHYDYMSDAEMEEAQAELQAEQGWAMPVKQAYETPSDEVLHAAGIMAEEAYQPIEYSGGGNATLTFRAPWSTGARREYNFQIIGREDGLATADPDRIEGDGPGVAIGLMDVSRKTAEDYNRRVAASIDLTKRGFDLFTAVPTAARKRVAETWQDIAGLANAFKLKTTDPMVYRGAPPAPMLQAFADHYMEGTGWSAEVSPGRYKGWLDMVMTAPDGTPYEVPIERVPGSNPRLVVHSSSLDKGSGAGTVLYQTVFAFAQNLGMPTNADSMGLTGVNTYRRTEQMMSAAARLGSTKNANPGVGQRIYGWNTRTATQEQDDRNFVRLALASARNAAEMVPRVRDLAYDLAKDEFTWRRGPDKGKSAEDFVKSALADKDVRTLSGSRSQLARAAVTFAAIDNEIEIDPDTRVKSPILYSTRNDAGEYAQSDDPFADDYKALAGKKVRLEFSVEGQSGPAVVTIDAASYLRELDERRDVMRRLAECLG